MITPSRSGRLAALALVTLVSACSGGSTSTPPAPTTVTTSTADATGDATAGGGTPWDITQVVTSRAITAPTSLSISVTFAQAISATNLPAPGAPIATPTQLGTVIVFATGGSGTSTGALNGCVGTPNFPNVTYLLDPGAIASPRLADGNFAVYNTITMLASGEASIAFTGPNTLTYTVPLSAIGGGSGAVQMAAVAINGATGPGSPNPTDCAPNATYIST
jgi:hypothetical protein